MSTNTNGNGNGFIYFVVGALVAVVAGFGIYYFTDVGGPADDGTDFSVSVNEDGIAVEGD